MKQIVDFHKKKEIKFAKTKYVQILPSLFQ